MELLRVSWRTVGRIVTRVSADKPLTGGIIDYPSDHLHSGTQLVKSGQQLWSASGNALRAW
jgi:hypothetical protein